MKTQPTQFARLARCALACALAFTPPIASAQDPESCGEPRFADVGWTDITATTALVSVALESLGYAPHTTVLGVPVTYASLANGDIDIFLGNWMPTMEADLSPYRDDGSVVVLPAANLEGAQYTLAAPRYAHAAGLTSFADIAKFHDKLDGKIYGIEPGNDGNRLLIEMIESDEFGLGEFELVESSEAGMLTQAERAMRRGEWIVFLGWTPHPVMAEMEIEFLEGSDPGGNFGGAQVFTNLRRGYADECPNVARLLANLKFDLKMESAVMGRILDGEDAEKAARKWLMQNPAALARWLRGVKTIDGKDGLGAAQSALGA